MTLTWTPPNERRTFYLIDENETIKAQARYEYMGGESGEVWTVFLPPDHPENYRSSLPSEMAAKAWAEEQVEKREAVLK